MYYCTADLGEVLMKRWMFTVCEAALKLVIGLSRDTVNLPSPAALSSLFI